MTHPHEPRAASSGVSPAVEWPTPTAILIAAHRCLAQRDADILVVLAWWRRCWLAPAPVEQDVGGLNACAGRRVCKAGTKTSFNATKQNLPG